MVDETTELVGAIDTITPADILRGAALYLDRHGWHQGAYYPERRNTAFPPACAIGAIRMAACGHPVTFADDLDIAQRRLVRATTVTFAAYLDPDYDAGTDDSDALDAISVIAGWNDDHWRYDREVYHALRDAAGDYDHDDRVSGDPS